MIRFLYLILLFAGIVNADEAKKVFPEEYTIKMPKLGKDFYEKNLSDNYHLSGRLRFEQNSGVQKLVPINKTIYKALKASKKDISRIANFFPGVKAETIAACILAENTMNVSVTDRAEEWLANNSQTVFSLMASAFGKDANSVSLGLGQINVSAARPAEPYVMKIEGRKTVRTSQELQQVVQTPSGSFLYVGAIIQHAIDEYQKQGMDIRQRPDIQCTLFNIGNPAHKASRSKKKGRMPKPNYFGFFVNHYFDEIQKNIKVKEVAIPKSKINNSLQIATEGPIWSRRNTKILTQIELHRSPGNCNTKSSAVQINKPPKQKAIGSFQEYSFHIDCKLKSWTYLKTKDGRFGWSPTFELQQASTSNMMTKIEFDTQKKQLQMCVSRQSPEQLSCMKEISSRGIQIERAAGDTIILENFDEELDLIRPKQSISNSTIRGWRKDIDQKKSAILKYAKRKKMGFSKWDDSKNPYRKLFSWMDELENCKKQKRKCSLIHGLKGDYHLSYTLRARGLLNDDDDTKSVRKELENVKVVDFILSKTPTINNNALDDTHKNKLLIAAGIKKVQLLKYLNKKGTLLSGGWNDPKNPYLDLFKWVTPLEQCKSCSINLRGRSIYDVRYIIQDRGLLSSERRLDYLKKIVVSKMSTNNFAHIKGRPFLNKYKDLWKSCSNLGVSNSHHYSTYNSIANLTPDQLSNSVWSERFNEIADETKLNCELKKKCTNFKITQNWNKCNELKDDLDISFFCGVTLASTETQIKEGFKKIGCLDSRYRRNRSCNIKSINQNKRLNKLADLACVKQIIFSKENLMETISNDLNSSNRLKKKSTFSPFSTTRQIAILLEDKCKLPENNPIATSTPGQ